MELKRVVVTGLGAITPIGNTAPETWAALLNGVSGAGPITQFDASKFSMSRMKTRGVIKQSVLVLERCAVAWV